MTLFLWNKPKHRPCGRCVLVALCATGLLNSDAPRPDWLRVVFLGRGTAAEDRAFTSYVNALQRTQPNTWARVRVDFANISDVPEEQQPQRIAAIARTRPAALLAPNGNVAKLATRHAPGTPLVFSTYINPVEAGIVSGMERRHESATGIWVTEQLDGKRLEVLRDAYPKVRRVAVLIDRSWNHSVNSLAPAEKAAAALGLEAQVLLADSTDEAQTLLDLPASRDFDAWVVPRSYVAVLALPMIVNRLRMWHKPLIVSSVGEVHSGAPLSYGVDTKFIWPTLAELTARVLGGEAASAIPVQRPQRFLLAVRTGAETGLQPPSMSVMRRADVVIR